MLYRVDHVSGTSFTFCANHSCAFGDATEGFSQIARAADEWRLESVFVHVVSFVGRGQNFGLVNIVHPKFLQDLRFGEVADAAFGHHRNGDGGHDLADLFGAGHTGYAAFGADLCGDTLQGHDRSGASLFGDLGLFGVGHVHDDAAF